MTQKRLISKPTPAFVQGVRNGLAAWYEKTKGLEDSDKLAEVDADVRNLMRMLDFALQLPECWEPTAELMAQVFKLPDRRGYWNLWLEKLEGLFERIPDPNAEIAILLQIQYGKLFRLIWKQSNAINVHKKAIEQAQNLLDKEILAKAQMELAWDYYNVNNLEKAIQTGIAALNVYLDTEVESKVQHVDTLRILGICETGRGNWKQAEDYLKFAYKISCKISDVLVPARTLINLGILYRRMGYPEKGLESNNQAKALLEGTRYESDLGNILLNNGTIYYDLGNWDAAEELFLQGYNEYARKSSDVNSQMHFINNLGNVYLKQGRLQESEAYLRDALAMRPVMGGEIGRADNLVTLARAMFQQGKKIGLEDLIISAEKLLRVNLENEWAKEIIKDIEKLQREMEN